MTAKKKIICLIGPTATGKTRLAVELVQKLPCDIISVDSAMVYRGMDIGTAKPTADMLAIAPHRLIDQCDPSEVYSVGRFLDDARREIDLILNQGRIPLLVGGTMLYFRALQRGLSVLPSADPQIREQITLEAQQRGWAFMHEQLRQKDPDAAERIHPNDPQRIQRALEVYLITGKSITELCSNTTNPLSHYEMVTLGLMPLDRDILYQRIALRFQDMLAHGFIDEVRGLFQRGDLNSEMPSMRSVGYRQVWEYLDGKCCYEEMQERGIIASRQLSKRQSTWLRRWPKASFFDAEDSKIASKLSAYIIS